MKLKNYITENTNYKTKKDETGHSHDAVVNIDGDGKTVSTDGDIPQHEHSLFQWMIQPASGHIHNLDI